MNSVHTNPKVVGGIVGGLLGFVLGNLIVARLQSQEEFYEEARSKMMDYYSESEEDLHEETGKDDGVLPERVQVDYTKYYNDSKIRMPEKPDLFKEVERIKEEDAQVKKTHFKIDEDAANVLMDDDEVTYEDWLYFIDSNTFTDTDYEYLNPEDAKELMGTFTVEDDETEVWIHNTENNTVYHIKIERDAK